MKSTNSVEAVHLLRIVLVDVKPAVWRELLVPSEIRLDRLHLVIQIAMGWDNAHMHEFIAGTLREGRRFGWPNPDDDPLFGMPATENESKFTLAEIAPAKGDKFRYWYDFGDDWYHQISVKGVISADPSLKLPLCILASRACPPEDCGGPWGYSEMLKALADAGHERHEELQEWIGDDFDPAFVDVDAINAALAAYAKSWKRARRT